MKKVWVFVVVLVFLTSLVFAVGQLGRHQGSNVLGVIGNPSIKLVGDSSFGHKNSEIYINVGGSMKTFDVALSDGSLKNILPGSSPASYSSSQIIFGETANNILVTMGTTEKSLQDALNEGDFLQTSWNIGDWGDCSKTCGGGTKSRSVKCNSENGTVVADNYCIGEKPENSTTCNTQNCPSGGSCFTEGTLVTLADGTSKPIEEIMVGDMVLGYDVDKKKFVSEEVLELESPMREGYYILSLEDGTQLNVTNEHPIYARNDGSEGWASLFPDKTYEDAKMIVRELKLGDEVFKGDNGWVKIVNVSYVDKPIRTYNLKRVSGSNTFFAGGVLVHNKSVICTEYYDQGFTDGETYKLESIYAAKYLSTETIKGYHAWAVPFTRLLRLSPEMVEKMTPLVNGFNEEILYLFGLRDEENEIGKLIIEEGLPISERLGSLLGSDSDWRSLYGLETTNEKDNKYDVFTEGYFTEERFEEAVNSAELKSSNDLEFTENLLKELNNSVSEIEKI